MSHKCLFVTVFTSEPSCVILENALMACARKPKVSKTMIKTRRHTKTMMTKMEMLVCGEDVGDVDEEDVGDVDDEEDGDVYDYVLMSLPHFTVISVTRTILGRNHFH